LEEAGFSDLSKLANTTVEELTKIKGIGKTSAEKIIEGAKTLVGQGKFPTPQAEPKKEPDRTQI